MSTDLKHTCHECGSRMAYPDHAKGMEVNCPNCCKSTSLGEVYPANPAPQPVVSSSAPPTASSAGTTTGHSVSAGLPIARRSIGWPVWAGAGLLVAALCVGLFFYLRPIHVAGHLYVVMKNNSVVNIPDTKGFVLTDKGMQTWVSSVNKATALAKQSADTAVASLVAEHIAIKDKMTALTLKAKEVNQQSDAMKAQIDKLWTECGSEAAGDFAETVSEISVGVLGTPDSPIKRLIEEMMAKNALAYRPPSGSLSRVQADPSFVLETNLLRHASNTMFIARANQTKVYNAYRLQGDSFGALDASDVRRSYDLAVRATNAFLGIKAILARTEELRPKRVQFVRLLKAKEALPSTETDDDFKKLDTERRSKVTAIAREMGSAKQIIGAIPLYALRQMAELSEKSGKPDAPAGNAETGRIAKGNVWTYQTNVEGKLNVRLPKKDVYHFVTIVKHLDEDYFLHKRVELTQGRDHKVVLNQQDNVKWDYEAWDVLGFKVRGPQRPPLTENDFSVAP